MKTNTMVYKVCHGTVRQVYITQLHCQAVVQTHIVAHYVDKIGKGGLTKNLNIYQLLDV